MSSVIGKKKQTLLEKFIGKIKAEPLMNEQRDMDGNIPLADIYINDDDMQTIVSRRKELRTSKHDNKNVKVIFNGNS